MVDPNLQIIADLQYKIILLETNPPECIHCGRRDPNETHWETCPNHPAAKTFEDMRSKMIKFKILESAVRNWKVFLVDKYKTENWTCPHVAAIMYALSTLEGDS